MTALQHREPDRIPFDLGSTKVTGITRNAYLNLARRLGEEMGTFEFYDVTQQLAAMGEGILRRLEVDTRGWMPNSRGSANKIIEADDEQRDCDGCLRRHSR